jgi:hypothetical protein
MKVIRGALKTGIAVKAYDMARREMSKPENQRKAKEMLAKVQGEFRKPENRTKAKEMLGKAQGEFRKPENQKKAKDLLGKVTKRSKSSRPA